MKEKKRGQKKVKETRKMEEVKVIREERMEGDRRE